MAFDLWHYEEIVLKSAHNATAEIILLYFWHVVRRIGKQRWGYAYECDRQI